MPDAREGRFGTMFPHVEPKDAGTDAIEALAAAMVKEEGRSHNNRRIPAGYTYLGQFVDHDITFDTTSQLRRANDPDTLDNFRTPRFDLDSVYGSGPVDQPFLYEWDDLPNRGVKLLVEGDDLPRNSQDQALIGDPRNDENAITSQLHGLFLRFHNKVVEHVREGQEGLGNSAVFEEARRLVRWHYQWIVMHDFLPKIVGDAAAKDEREPDAFRDGPFMPVEFSCGAYRFGHSLVRESYRLNATSGVLPLFSADGDGKHLGGRRKLDASLKIEWERFFRVTDTPPGMHSMCIDARLAKPLTHVPPDKQALARLNLERGRALEVPAGADVARAMEIEPLTEQQLGLDCVADQNLRDALLDATPLWYYVLSEAEALADGGLHLGPVGGRIVAEVFWGLLKGDPGSYSNAEQPWKPELPRADDATFTMGDLIRFTQGEE